MSAPLAIPATPRESHAIWVEAAPAERMASARPGASRSITARVASGVTSRGPNPVPPVVTTSGAREARSRSEASMVGVSSGTTSGASTS